MSSSLIPMLAPYLKGFFTGGGLIVAIGAQNAFVLTQGLKREFHWPIASLCSLIDITLIGLGLAGMGLLIQQSPLLLQVATWGGALFLLLYGLRAFMSALHPGRLETSTKRVSQLRTALLTTLALSLLNPHVYLDTVVLLGSIGGRYPLEERLSFGLGAASASVTWFFTLVLAVRWLAPLFNRPNAWRVLDLLVGMSMWGIALTLLLPAFGF